MSYITDYHNQWTAVLALCLLASLRYFVFPRFGLIPTVFFGFLASSSIWVWSFKANRYVSINPYDQMALRYLSADSILKAFLVLVPLFIFLDRREVFFKYGRETAKYFIYLNSLSIIFQALIYGCAANNSCGGFVGNPSLSAGLMVAILPILIKGWKEDFITLAMVSLAVFISKSSIAIGLLAIYIFLSLLGAGAFVVGISALFIIFIGAYSYMGSELFNSSDRFKIWVYMMDRWDAWWNVIGGTGLGTYKVFSINLQHDQNVAQNTWWSTLHNDWLQTIFENGIIGGILAVATYTVAILRSISRKEIAIVFSLILYGIYMGGNAALHHAPAALFGAWLFTYALHLTGETS